MWTTCILLLWLATSAGDSSKEYRAFYKFFEAGSPPSRLRRRFRQLALEFHPDHQKAGTDKEAAQRKFLLLTTAFEKLLARSRAEDPGEEARARATRMAAEERLKEEARRKQQERAQDAERQRRAAERARQEEEEARALEREMLALDEERAGMSRLLEKLFLLMLSVATVLGIGLAYYFFALRDEAVLDERRRTLEAATSVGAEAEESAMQFAAATPVAVQWEAPVRPVAAASVAFDDARATVDCNAQEETQVETVNAAELMRAHSAASLPPPQLLPPPLMSPPEPAQIPATGGRRKPLRVTKKKKNAVR